MKGDLKRSPFLFTEMQSLGGATGVIAIDPYILDVGVKGLPYEGTPAALV